MLRLPWQPSEAEVGQAPEVVPPGDDGRERQSGGKPHQSGGQSHHRHRHHRPVAGTTSLVTVGAVAAGYATLRGGIKVFHHARRRFLRQLLFDLLPALDAAGATYWLDFGSLLGVYRDGDLILHDNDIDVVVLDPDWTRLLPMLQRQLPQYGFKTLVPSEDPTACFARAYCPLGMADLFGATLREDGRLSVECGHGDATSIHADLILPTGSLTWRGAVLAVPRDLEGALHARYGPTWKIARYMDKGADVIEHDKTYAKVFRALAKCGIKL